MANEMSGVSATTATTTGTSSNDVNWEDEYKKLLKKYTDMIRELDNLGFTLLSYSRTMKQQQQIQ